MTGFCPRTIWWQKENLARSVCIICIFNSYYMHSCLDCFDFHCMCFVCVIYAYIMHWTGPRCSIHQKDQEVQEVRCMHVLCILYALLFFGLGWWMGLVRQVVILLRVLCIFNANNMHVWQYVIVFRQYVIVFFVCPLHFQCKWYACMAICHCFFVRVLCIFNANNMHILFIYVSLSRFDSRGQEQ
jgi:hypothetical protein